MKYLLSTVFLLLAFHWLGAQDYQLKLPVIRSVQWTHPRWKSVDSSAHIRIRSLDRTWFFSLKIGQIFFDEEKEFEAERKSGRLKILDKDGKLQVERKWPLHYILEDGTLLRRRHNIWHNKLKIVHPDGRVLVEGRIRTNLTGHHLSMRVVSSTQWDKALLALFAIDMVEFLGNR